MSAEPARPSARAVERLATGVGEDVAGLRTRLHRALEEADRLQAAGRDDLAVSVLQEQRDALLVIHQQLEARLADAAVEREAERVLGRAALDAPDPACTPTVTASEDGMALRLVASAVAAVLGVALLLSPELGSGGLTAAGSSATSDAIEDNASRGAADVNDAGTTSSGTVDGRDGRMAETTQALQLGDVVLPEADARSPRTRDMGDDDLGPTGGGKLRSLPDVGPVLDALRSATPELPEAEGDQEEDSAETHGDGGSTADDGDATVDQDGHDDAPQDGREQDDGATSSSPEAASDRDDGTDEGSSAGDGSTRGNQSGPGGEDTLDGDGDGSSSGGLELGNAGGEPLSREG